MSRYGESESSLMLHVRKVNTGMSICHIREVTVRLQLGRTLQQRSGPVFTNHFKYYSYLKYKFKFQSLNILIG